MSLSGEARAWTFWGQGAKGHRLPPSLTYLVPAGPSQELAGGLCVRGRSLEAGFNTLCKPRQREQLLTRA